MADRRTVEVERDLQVTKVDDSLGLVFGWGAISFVDGEPYYDHEGDHISDEEIMKCALDELVANEDHILDAAGNPVPAGNGTPYKFPLTRDVAKSYGIETKTHGLMIGVHFAPDVFKKYRSGEYKSFSIGGRAKRREAVPA